MTSPNPRCTFYVVILLIVLQIPVYNNISFTSSIPDQNLEEPSKNLQELAGTDISFHENKSNSDIDLNNFQSKAVANGTTPADLFEQYKVINTYYKADHEINLPLLIF